MSCSMKWKIVTARTTKINRAATTPLHGVEHYCRDLNGWPRSWMGLEKDLPPGEQLVTLFRPFLEYLAASNLSPKTIQKHVDNMWVLGGEFIRDLHNEPPLRRQPVDPVLSKRIEYGGPLRTTAGKISKDRLIPPAESSGGSSSRGIADARIHPQIPPTRQDNGPRRWLSPSMVRSP